MVTYNVGNTNGLRLLNGAGFSGEYSSTLTTNTNVKLTADTAASTVSVNSLILNGFSITNPGSAATITISTSGTLAGNILISSAANIAGANTTLGIGTAELNIHAAASSTISAIIGTAVAGSLTISGTGSVTLSAAAAYTGTTSINSATLTYGASNVISSGGVTIVGGTLAMGTASDTVGAVILQNGSITGSSGVLSGTSYSFREGTVSAILGGGAATVTVIATNTAPDTVVTLSGNNTYTGTTTITSGILKLGAAGDGTNSPLGVIGGATLVASGGALDLNGITLSTAEPISSLAGTGFGGSGSSNMGAVMNSSGSSVSYSGAITLTAAARINADYGALTVSSAISGATFTLTIGGFSNSTFSGIISTSIAVTKDGIGTLTLSNGSSSYTGVTTINVGTLKLGAVSVGGTNSPLGTTGGATAITAGARLDLNGFSLGIAEAVTNLNGNGYGLGDFASGAIINSSGSSVAWTGTITLGTASTIKADSGTITLSAITGAFALTLGGTGSGIVSGVFGAGAATLTKIDTGTWTMSGVNTFTGITSINLGTLKFGVNDAAGGGPLGTAAAATTVYSGAVLDLDIYSSSALAEGLTINGFGINGGGAMLSAAPGGGATYLGTRALGSDSRTTNSGAGLLTLSGIQSGVFESRYGGSGNITISAAIAATASLLTKDGAGTLNLTAANGHTGLTKVNGGTIAAGIANALSSGGLTVNAGTYSMGANSDTVGAVTLIGGSITSSSGVLTGTSYTFESGTISAILAGAVAVTKNTKNTVTLSGVNTISSTMTINAGTLAISGSGSDVSVTAITVNLGGTLTLDNSTTAVASRLLDTIVLTMNGGNFNFSGNSAAAASETIGQFAFASGHNVVTITPGAGGSTIFTAASNPGFNRSAGATVLFRGTSLGSASAANVSTLMFTTTPTLTGGGGASSTTTVSIIKGAFGDSSLSGTGSDMVTYNKGNTNGLRLLNGAGFSGEYATNLATTNSNVKLTADAAASTVTINSIILNNFSITNPGSAQTITLSTTGNILANSATSIAGANTTLGISTSELDVLATANATISAVIGTATTGSLALSGPGNVTLSAANPYTGTTFVNNATFTYGASNVISSGALTIVGGTVNLNGNSDTVGSISINAGTIATAAGTLTGNGTFSTVANNNVASIITGNLGLGANATFTINNGLMDNDALITAVISGAFTFAKAGAGVLELAGSNTYTGATTISAGTLRLGAAGDATNTPLGTAGNGTTVASGFSLDLNGYSLGTSEALTISGTGISTRGALMNTSSNAVTYSGLITLGAAASIYADYGTMTLSNTGSMTGTGFALTLRGAGNGSLATQINTSTAGSLVKNDLGTWTISGDGNYTGVTTITAGTLKLGAAGGATNNPFGTVGGATTVASGAILDLNGFTPGTAEPLTISGTGIANTGAFINSSNNSISYSGAITLGAAVRVANYGSGVFTLTGAISGNFALTTVTVGGITQSSASVWSGTGTLVKEGSGTLILTGQNTMTGAMTVSTGKLQLGASGGATNTPLGTNAGGVTVSAGAVLDMSTFSLGGASTYETLNISGSGISNAGALTFAASSNNNFGAVTVAANARVINSGSGTVIFGGTITIANTINLGIGGTGPTTISGVFGATATTATLTKWDSGTLSINAASITTGLVRINGGTLQYGVNDALSTPTLTVAGGTLNLSTFNETNIGATTLVSGSITGTGTLTSTATFTLEGGTISAPLGGTVVAAIAKNTAGRVTLSGNNTFSGTAATIAVNAGYLNLQHNNALGAAASANTTTVLGGATVELENSITIPSVKAFTVNGTGVGRVGAIRSVSGTNSIGANITLGTTNVRINSDSGTLTIPSVSGNTFNVIFGGAGTVAVTGAIATTSGSLTKNGAGTLTLTGTNTYTGPTTILEGILSANATAALGDGSATNTLILSGGTLQAAGAITSGATRAFTLAANSTIDTNGNSISVAGSFGGLGSLTKSGSGTLTITGTTTLGGNLTISAGTFAPTNVVFSGTNTQSIAGFTATGTMLMTKTAGTATFAGNIGATSLTINGTGGTLNLGSGLTHTFSGDVTLTAGTLDGGSSTLNVNSVSATAWNGTGSVFSAGTGTVVFGGLSNQTLAASATTFNNLTFSGDGTKTFTSATTINGTFNNVGGSPAYALWSQSDKSTHITLSNGDLRATSDGASNHQVRATIGKSSGKWYWESTFHRTNANDPYYVPGGISKTSGSVEDYTGSTANGVCFTTDTDGASHGSKWTSGTQTTGYNTIADWVDGDVVGMALDMDAGTITVYRNNVSLGVMLSGLSGTYYPATGSSFTPGYTTANFGATAFTYTPPVGFNSGIYTGGSSTIATGNQTITLGGDFTNTGTAFDAGSSNIILAGTSTQSLAGFTTTGTVSMTKTAGTATLQGAVNAGALTINGVGGTLNLGTGLTHTITGATTVTNGTLDGGSSNITTASFSSSNSNTRTLALGTGTWSLTGTGTVWDMTTSTGATITPGSSTIKLTNASASAKTFAGGGNTYNNLWFAPAGGSGSFTISGNNTFNNFKDDGTAAHSILFTTGSTQSFSSWSVVGNPGQLISIDSTTTGTHNLQIVGSGSVSSDYLNIQHSVATPSGRWFAGAHSTNNQGVSSPGSGWFFFVESTYRGGGGGAGGESQNGGGGGVTGGGGGGGAPTTATGIVVQSGGVIQSVTMVVNGSGYTSAPIVSFCIAGTGGVGTAVLTGDAVTSVIINNGGSGYTNASIVLFGSACPTTGGGSGGGGDSG
jgi:autotransporter-associated beta strand protein